MSYPYNNPSFTKSVVTHDIFGQDPPFGPLTQSSADSRYVHQDGTGLPSSVVSASSAINANTGGAYGQALSSSALIDLCRPFGIFTGAVPGNDVTSMLQAAVNALTTQNPAVDIVFSIPGQYLLNGAQQTGTFVSNALTTTLSAQTTLPASTITVASTSGFESAGGQISVGGQLVTYTGKSGTTFTGCTGGTGTIASGATVSLAYGYSGQILFPAFAPTFTGGANPVVRIRGLVPARVSQSNAQTVTLVSNATSGNVFDVIPGGQANGDVESGVSILLQDHVLELPINPQCGGYKLQAATFASVSDVVVLGNGGYATTQTGSQPGLWMPGKSSNGQSIRNFWAQSLPIGLIPGDHCTMEGDVQVWNCAVGVDFRGNENPVKLNVHVGGCLTAIRGTAGTNDVYGRVFVESYTTGSVAISDPSGHLTGELTLDSQPGFIPSILPQNQSLHLRAGLNNGNARGTDDHPVDTFTRSASAPTSGSSLPGNCNQTLHPWSTTFSTGGFGWALNSGGGIKLANAVYSVLSVPTRNGGETRLVQMTVTLAPTNYDVRLLGAMNTSTGTGIIVRAVTGNIQLRTTGSTVFQTYSAGLSGSSTYTIGLLLLHNETGLYRAKALLNGVVVCDAWIPPGSLPGIGSSWPYVADGIICNADASVFTDFRVLPQSATDVGSLQSTLAGTTAGSAVSSMPFQGATYKKFLVGLQGYENTTGTPQTITYPTAFTQSPKITSDDSGGSTTNTTTLTLPASMGATKTGWIVVEGY